MVQGTNPVVQVSNRKNNRDRYSRSVRSSLSQFVPYVGEPVNGIGGKALLDTDEEVGDAIGSRLVAARLVRGRDETAVRALFSPRALEVWTSLQQRGWSACGADRWLLVYRDHRLIPPRRLGDFLEQARMLAQSLGAI